MSSRRAKVRRTIGVLGATAALAGLGSVFAAFTATTTNPGNSAAAGSVVVSDSDGADVPMYTTADDGTLAPGDQVVRCIKVTYGGTLTASAVRLYVSGGITNGTNFDLKVERGTQTTGAFPGCGDFAASSTAYDGALGSFGTTYAGGVDGKASAGTWAQNDAVAYRFTIAAVDDPTANAHSTVEGTGSHTFTWEARS